MRARPRVSVEPWNCSCFRWSHINQSSATIESGLTSEHSAKEAPSGALIAEKLKATFIPAQAFCASTLLHKNWQPNAPLRSTAASSFGRISHREVGMQLYRLLCSVQGMYFLITGIWPIV